jgi:NADH-quinone oxidoreductase subunit I
MMGIGMLQGLWETARNFFGSFFFKDRLTTVQYPEQRLPRKEASRNFPFLVFDGEDWQKGMRCVSCFICEKECPPKCIHITKSTEKKPDATGKMQFYPEVFDIDVSVCMSCQICVEVCPFDAIKMDNDFELTAHDRFGDLLLHSNQLAKSNEYFNSIHPIEAAEVDTRLAEERAAAKAKADAAAAAKATAPPTSTPPTSTSTPPTTAPPAAPQGAGA